MILKTHREKCVLASVSFFLIFTFAFVIFMHIDKTSNQIFKALLLMMILASLYCLIYFSIRQNDLFESSGEFVLKNSVRKRVFKAQDAEIHGCWYGKTRDGFAYRYYGVVACAFYENGNSHYLDFDLTKENYYALLKLIQTSAKSYISAYDFYQMISKYDGSNSWNLAPPSRS